MRDYKIAVIYIPPALYTAIQNAGITNLSQYVQELIAKAMKVKLDVKRRKGHENKN